ncbi:hypothetical protein [Marinobacterium arenosum]|uniref:hypothetical protein n=1 Tax=Marinobacterium arenosum TaxID=2862496 RepID=UPI001C960A23|nr:hypothetical protein [Marinobacterium arenosum]MBY4675904.1 hypothetical protein [Marinobacterium arenosum]
MENAAIAELQKLTNLGVGPFVHPRRMAQLMGCSYAQIIKGMNRGVVPVALPFAQGFGKERPTRYVDMLRWIEQVRSQRPY